MCSSKYTIVHYFQFSDNRFLEFIPKIAHFILFTLPCHAHNVILYTSQFVPHAGHDDGHSVDQSAPLIRNQDLVCLTYRTCVGLQESGATNQIAQLLINTKPVRNFLAHCIGKTMWINLFLMPATVCRCLRALLNLLTGKALSSTIKTKEYEFNFCGNHDVIPHSIYTGT